MLDFIIIGQGLAGSVLGYMLLKREKKILVVDSLYGKSASEVAAGIFNPITGKRMLKTWRADDFFPFMIDFYQNMQNDLKGEFLYLKPIYKPFSSIQEQNHWVAQTSFADIENFVSASLNSDTYGDYIFDSFGGFKTCMSGNVEVKTMLELCRYYFIENEAFAQDKFSPIELEVKEDYVQWQNIKARQIIFCEGSRAIGNPFFNWVPFVPAKGEVLTIEAPGLTNEVIFNKSAFVMPCSKEAFKVGATYEWDFANEEPSEAGRQEIERKLDGFLKIPYKVIRQEAAVRPTVKDRRPVIGLHPQYKSLAIFNGMGTKGVSLAPFFANNFCNFLERGEELDASVNITRFHKLYYTLQKN